MNKWPLFLVGVTKDVCYAKWLEMLFVIDVIFVSSELLEVMRLGVT